VRVLILADADAQLGLGHLQRCLALAAALRTRGIGGAFLTGHDPRAAEHVRREGIEKVVIVSPRAAALDAEAVAGISRTHGCDTVVVDSYEVDDARLAALVDHGLTVVAIDDLAAHPFSCHVVINGGAHAADLPYVSTTGRTQFLLGPRYALLRSAFAGLPRRAVEGPVREALVIFGGADPFGLTPTVVRLLDHMEGDFRITGVVGPFAANGDEVKRAARHCRKVVEVVERGTRLDRLLHRADLAVSGGGQTVYELAACGTPTVAVEVAANQRASLAALEAAGVLILAGWAGHDRLADQIRLAVERLLADPGARAAMAAAGQALIDGHGSPRVAAALLAQGRPASPVAPDAPRSRRRSRREEED
jgi:UDP-2,4-diacetamido-2,4,6-trideoxy-beta-L-altropyranose hydrolase